MGYADKLANAITSLGSYVARRWGSEGKYSHIGTISAYQALQHATRVSAHAETIARRNLKLRNRLDQVEIDLRRGETPGAILKHWFEDKKI